MKHTNEIIYITKENDTYTIYSNDRFTGKRVITEKKEEELTDVEWYFMENASQQIKRKEEISWTTLKNNREY